MSLIASGKNTAVNHTWRRAIARSEEFAIQSWENYTFASCRAKKEPPHKSARKFAIFMYLM